MTPYRPRVNLFHLIAVAGLSLSAYYGYAWTQLPAYSEAEIEASVELNLAIDLSRRGPHLQPDEAGLERLREQVRAEVIGDLDQARDTVQRRLGIGLLLLVVGGGRVLTSALKGQGEAAPPQ
jgi:hypothetical protein